MSEVVAEAVSALSAKMDGRSFDSTAKFSIEGEGCVMIDENGVHAGDEEAEVTLSANADTFQQIMEGDLDPTSAFMSGKLSIDGDMGTAMQLASVLA